MTVTAADIDALLRESFPARSENDLATLEYVTTAARDDGTFGVIVRLIRWEPNPGSNERLICDIKEQEIYFDPADSNVERLQQYIKALVYSLERALGHPEVETLMPHDLFITDVLKLAKAQTEEQFVKALSVKSRLGRWLPAIG